MSDDEFSFDNPGGREKKNCDCKRENWFQSTLRKWILFFIQD